MLPILTDELVAKSINDLSDVKKIGQGGQKLVYRAKYKGELCALKFMLVPDDVTVENFRYTDYGIRAIREVETMRNCSSEHMVKPGPLDLHLVTIDEQQLLCFSEELIDGFDLANLLIPYKPFPDNEVARIGYDIADAIEALWKMKRIHRDIKPQNIMKSTTTRGYILLDAGLAFDLEGESVSAGYTVGTRVFFSPEQCHYTNRRNLDQRSDMFALGVTLYLCATGAHPFWKQGQSQGNVIKSILNDDPDLPSNINPNIDRSLEAVIMKLLRKTPHERFKTATHLKASLATHV